MQELIAGLKEKYINLLSLTQIGQHIIWFFFASCKSVKMFT